MNEILRKSRLLAVLFICSTQTVACGFGYYWQATTGHLSIMNQRRPVAEVLADEETPDAVKSSLQTASVAVEFAHQEMLLPDNGSYQLYADTGRRYVVWNVVATPEFSLQPRTWCFPVAGCVSYRGYFGEAQAREFADEASGAGDDVYVGGVTAYSTLGRFADPLLNTMMEYPDYKLAGLIFHELAHQLIYVKDDSKFNEGFASFVEEEGIYRWLQSRQDEGGLCRYESSSRRRRQVMELVMQTREQLQQLFAEDIGAERKRIEKQALFDELRGAYAGLSESGAAGADYGHWFDASLNNARLAALATYDDYLPAFAGLLREESGDLASFYRRAEELAALPVDERQDELRKLQDNKAEITRKFGRRSDGACRGESAI